MIKRLLYFGNPAQLSVKLEQLCIKTDERTSVCSIEDIGEIIFDHPQIVTTQAVWVKLLQNNVAIIQCDEKHLPVGLLLPFEGNSRMQARQQLQIKASEPLKKQLWQQTIQQKIANQAQLCQQLRIAHQPLLQWAAAVKTGDKENHEARAAQYFWKHFFENLLEKYNQNIDIQEIADLHITRDRYGYPPNALLNYGYAILRATIARACVAAGLLPSLGIFHHNQYNAFCLADDLMEPYRPFVDALVYKIVQQFGLVEALTTEIKRELFTIPALDVWIDGQRSPLMVASHRTAQSFVKCLEGERRKILFPSFP